MVEMTDIGIDNAVAFRMWGKVTESDMTLVLSDAKEKINRYGNIVILEVIESFEGIEIAALVEEFKYLYEVGISNISKVALVTDRQWMKEIVNIEGKIFKNIKMKCFSTEDKDVAIEFLKIA
jgi:hypothetical protein